MLVGRIMPHANHPGFDFHAPSRKARATRLATPWNAYIVSGYEPLLRGLGAVLREHPHVQSVGSAPELALWAQDPDGPAADILVIDLDSVEREPSLDEVLRSVDGPRRLILLHDDARDWPPALGPMLESGAVDGLALLSKAGSGDELADAVTMVAGGAFLCDLQALRVARGWNAAGARRGDSAGAGRGALSPREEEVFLLVASGCLNKEIARRLSVSEGTVKAHVSHIMAKLGIANRRQIVAESLVRERQARVS